MRLLFVVGEQCHSCSRLWEDANGSSVPHRGRGRGLGLELLVAALHTLDDAVTRVLAFAYLGKTCVAGIDDGDLRRLGCSAVR